MVAVTAGALGGYVGAIGAASLAAAFGLAATSLWSVIVVIAGAIISAWLCERLATMAMRRLEDVDWEAFWQTLLKVTPLKWRFMITFAFFSVRLPPSQPALGILFAH